MLLAGDIGGTKTLLGLFETAADRPQPTLVRAFATPDYDSLASMLAMFLREPSVAGASIQASCFGVAGPVLGQTAELTNLRWPPIDASALPASVTMGRLSLLNDLEALAWAVPSLHEDELIVLQQGDRLHAGNIALIAAGTGLGEALLHKVGGRFIPASSEGGHADFAARNEREVAVLRAVAARVGRCEVEQVVSGRGIVNLHQVTHMNRTCPALEDPSDPGAPAAISTAALERRCEACVEALELFVDAYGAEAGNLALRTVSTGGVFIGGGIAPKILPALTDGRFMRAFRDKAPLSEMLGRIPVRVILNPEAGLLGAAVFAQGTIRIW